MAKFIVNDALVMLRGLTSVSRAAINVTENELKEAWQHSSVRTGLKTVNLDFKNQDFSQLVNETTQRSFAVAKGLSEFSAVSLQKLCDKRNAYNSQSYDNLEVATAEGLIIQDNIPGYSNINEVSTTTTVASNISGEPTVTPSDSTDLHHKSAYAGLEDSKILSSHGKPVSINQRRTYASTTSTTRDPPNPAAKAKPTVRMKKRVPKLSETSREVAVPSSRIGRLATYGSLAASLGMGALAEVTRRSLGLSGKKKDGENLAILDSNPFLTEANAERIVDTLCKVRGAALKLGQMLSIQDNTLINPQLQKIFERVRKSADFMPVKQMESVLHEELGPDWRSKLLNFEELPFAAASVGQVHLATLHDGRDVAMKIQYPGVAKGIESDINNLVAVMNVWNILPKGLYMEEFIKVAKKELAWEVDYNREKECTKKFEHLLKDMPEYRVPSVVEELCTKQVFTAEFLEGVTIEKCLEMDQDTRNYIAEKLLWLCLTELFTFRFMQTDPNWANFMYNPATRQIVLLDFGASRDFPKQFVDDYIKVIEGAAARDQQKVIDYSRKLGFLAGYETKTMEDAHVEAVMILGEAFRHDEPFDFGTQDTTRRIQRLIPVMLTQRLCPPPQESYSLHRKMSGAFLLCAKLGAKINCKPFFDEICHKYYSSNNVANQSVA